MLSYTDEKDLETQSDEEVQSDDSDEADPENSADASSTEFDKDGDEVDDDEDIPETKPKVKKASPKSEAARLEKIQQQIRERYEKRKGRQLFIRFPAKLPTDIDEFNKKIKDLSELIVMGHKPRQKHARFCLVDFASTEDRDKAMKKLTKNSAENKLVVSLPRCEGENFVEKLAEKQMKKYKSTKAKKLIRKESMKTISGEFSSTIRILNIPNSTSVAQIKELIPEAVDVNLKAAPKKFAGTSIAMVTMPSTMDASKTARKTFTLGHNKLILKLNPKLNLTKSAVPSATGKKEKQQKNTEGEKQDNKELNSKKNKNKNKKNKSNGAGTAPEEKAKSTKLIEVSPKAEINVPKKKAKVVGNAPEVKEVVQNEKKKLNKNKKNKAANGSEAAPEDKVKSPKKRGINDDAEVELPKKMAKVQHAPEVKGVQNGKKNKNKKNTPKENNKTAEMKSDAAPNTKGPGKKPKQPNKQKKKGVVVVD